MPFIPGTRKVAVWVIVGRYKRSRCVFSCKLHHFHQGIGPVEVVVLRKINEVRFHLLRQQVNLHRKRLQISDPVRFDDLQLVLCKDAPEEVDVLPWTSIQDRPYLEFETTQGLAKRLETEFRERKFIRCVQGRGLRDPRINSVSDGKINHLQ
jgi:hypothetical protein